MTWVYLGYVESDGVEEVHAIVQREPEQHVHTVPLHDFQRVGAHRHVEDSVAEMKQQRVSRA